MRKVEDLGRRAIFNLNPYVPGKPVEEVERELGISGVIKLASNENPLGPSPLALEALQRAIARVNFYPDSNCFYLKRVLAAHLGCREENLIIGNGSDELLKLIAETFLEREDEVIFAHPSFSEYEFASKIMEANCISVPVKEDLTHDLEAMAKKIGPRTKLIFICNPNNPTGTIVTQEELQAFFAGISPDILIIVDEAYHEYVTDPLYPNSLQFVEEGRNVIILRTFSKIYGLAGLRIGYGISRPEIIALINRVREPFNVNLLAQEAARAGLEDKDHLKRSRDMVLEGKEYLYKAFQKMGLKYVPTHANFVFVNVFRDSREVFPALLREGVIVRTGDIFGYPTYIRVTIGTPQENERFIAGLERVLNSRR
ncbi:MAG: histidinol-phosphate transaminase [Bacillota bacterium]|nr:histidinol-phosphate transaminase [Bacillota bacterium]